MTGHAYAFCQAFFLFYSNAVVGGLSQNFATRWIVREPDLKMGVKIWGSLPP